MTVKKVAKRKLSKKQARRSGRKMKPAIVPFGFQEPKLVKVDKPSPEEFARLSSLPGLQRFQAKPKRRKYRLWKMVLIKEFIATPEKAQMELEKQKISEGENYFLDEVPPRRPRPIIVK